MFAFMYQRGSHERIFVKSDTGILYENLSRNSRYGKNRASIYGSLHEDLRTFTLLVEARNILQLYNIANKNLSFRFHGNTQRFYIVDSCKKVNNAKGTHQFLSIAAKLRELATMLRLSTLLILLNSAVQSGTSVPLCTAHNAHAILGRAAIPPHNKLGRNFTECFNINITLASLICKLPDDGRRPKHVAAI